MKSTALSELCQRCGMCCDGSLFTFLPMSDDEAQRMRLLGASTEKRKDGRWALLLKCRVLQGTCCGAYEQRPARCREFVCKLGRAVERGERSVEGAMTIVEEAKARLGALDVLLPPATDDAGVLPRAHRYEMKEPDDPIFKTVRTEARDIEAFLKNYFV